MPTAVEKKPWAVRVRAHMAGRQGLLVATDGTVPDEQVRPHIEAHYPHVAAVVVREGAILMSVDGVTWTTTAPRSSP